MALKADRYELQTDISFFMNAAVATRGGVVVHDSGSAPYTSTGSGAAMDQGVALVKEKAVANTDVPVGILLNDVVNKDLTRTHLNQHKDEVQLGSKVTILRKGYVVTNKIDSVTVAPGDVAYASASAAGNITNVCAASVVASGNLPIGRFLSRIDEDGYAKVEVNLPNHGTNN
jgi:hypothetical protein|tara:strand:+ start:192 stop:710 length:519 start_codon:yes stop_codon:yes gene_type:complete